MNVLEAIKKLEKKYAFNCEKKLQPLFLDDIEQNIKTNKKVLEEVGDLKEKLRDFEAEFLIKIDTSLPEEDFNVMAVEIINWVITIKIYRGNTFGNTFIPWEMAIDELFIRRLKIQIENEERMLEILPQDVDKTIIQRRTEND